MPLRSQDWANFPEVTPRPENKILSAVLNALGQSVYQGARDFVTLPGDVYQGKVEPTPEAAMNWVLNMAGGGLMAPRPKGSLGSSGGSLLDVIKNRWWTPPEIYSGGQRRGFFDASALETGPPQQPSWKLVHELPSGESVTLGVYPRRTDAVKARKNLPKTRGVNKKDIYTYPNYDSRDIPPGWGEREAKNRAMIPEPGGTGNDNYYGAGDAWDILSSLAQAIEQQRWDNNPNNLLIWDPPKK